MTARDVATAAAVGGVSGIAALFVLAAVTAAVKTVREARPQTHTATKAPVSGLSLLPGGAS